MSDNTGYAAVAIQTSGLHPATSRMVSLDIITFNAGGEREETFHAVLNPNEDPGPKHLHGLTPEEIQEGKTYEKIARKVCSLLDGRIVIMHNSARTWGFIISEARRVIRITRARARSKNPKVRKRAPRHIHVVPRPALIVDTLASARRQGIIVPDTRLRGLAQTLGLPTSPEASAERSRTPEFTFTRKNTQLVWSMYQILKKGTLASWKPQQLRADRFGLQRTIIRIEALDTTHSDSINPRPPIDAPPPFKGTLEAGMEIVVAPEIRMDPDIIIQAACDVGLTYQEKLTRRTSLVVCNETENLHGRAMHAQRKNIPLVPDTVFLELVKQLRP